MNTIAATTTRTGLKVRAELDTGSYPTGVRISDAQLQALPLHPHDWHGNWNYDLLPQAFPLVPARQRKSFDQASEELAWLCHPAVTGMPPGQWAALIRALGALHEDQREADARRRRGRERLKALGGGRPPKLTLVDRVLAAYLHDRLGLTQVAIAALFQVTPNQIHRRIHDIRALLASIGHGIEPATSRPKTTDDLRQLTETPTGEPTTEINPAC